MIEEVSLNFLFFYFIRLVFWVDVNTIFQLFSCASAGPH